MYCAAGEGGNDGRRGGWEDRFTECTPGRQRHDPCYLAVGGMGVGGLEHNMCRRGPELECDPTDFAGGFSRPYRTGQDSEWLSRCPSKTRTKPAPLKQQLGSGIVKTARGRGWGVGRGGLVPSSSCAKRSRTGSQKNVSARSRASHRAHRQTPQLYGFERRQTRAPSDASQRLGGGRADDNSPTSETVGRSLAFHNIAA